MSKNRPIVRAMVGSFFPAFSANGVFSLAMVVDLLTTADVRKMGILQPTRYLANPTAL